MESLPELDLVTEQPDKAIALLPRPSLLRNLGFWLLAMLLGSLLLLLYPVVAASSQKGGASVLPIRNWDSYYLVAGGLAAATTATVGTYGPCGWSALAAGIHAIKPLVEQPGDIGLQASGR